ncbi:uncharacterized protein LOC143829854 [Paroedura picta]|uniref:uncharacterized protein LOC143829854 n=1 Tax=Paroedura picta TaxID=143630 RepID=UPI004057514B
MASVMLGLWKLTVSVIIFSHISAAYPPLERHQRQAEAKVADYLGTLRELERTHNLLQTIMNSKRRDPNTFRVRDVSGFGDNITGDWRNSEETCLQIMQKLNASFQDNAVEDATQVISHSICQLLAEMNEEASGVAFGRSHG